MGKRAFNHFLVLRGGSPCVLLKHEHVCPDGVLLPAAAVGGTPTEFTCVRTNKYPTIYARRRALRAIDLTDRFVGSIQTSIINDHPFLAQVVAASRGLWQIQAYLCPKEPKPEPRSESPTPRRATSVPISKSARRMLSKLPNTTEEKASTKSAESSSATLP